VHRCRICGATTTNLFDALCPICALQESNNLRIQQESNELQQRRRRALEEVARARLTFIDHPEKATRSRMPFAATSDSTDIEWAHAWFDQQHARHEGALTKAISEQLRCEPCIRILAKNYRPCWTVSAKRFLSSIRIWNAVVFDVRSPYEFRAGHLETASNLFPYATNFDARIDALDRGATYGIYGETGLDAAHVRDWFKARRFVSVVTLDGKGGGLRGLQAAGGRVVHDPG
jgi:rhodanese-related sulfurtransferase